METSIKIYQIGTKYLTGGKFAREGTIKDVLKTYNLAGDLVHIRYVCEYEFAGQTIVNSDVVSTSIEMGLERLKERAAAK